MKRSTLALLLVAALAASTGQPALAAAKKPVKPKPITKTYYLHGTSANGNQDTFTGTALTMDATKPASASAKEIAMVGGNVAGALLVPKACPGGPYIPAWGGTVSGKLTGKVTVQFYARGSGGNVTVQLLADPSDCAAAPVIAAEALAPIPQSPNASLVTVTLTLPAKGVKVAQSLSLQFLTDQTTTAPPGAMGMAGISYDGTAASTALTFLCLPNAGKKSC